MRIALVTEAWLPQVNGVVTTWTHMQRQVAAAGHELHVIDPGLFRSLPCPRYPGVRLTVAAGRRLARMLDELSPDAIHIATEGPLGAAARRLCLRRGETFTTSYHTQFPEYLRHYFRIPASMTYAYMRRFHASAARTLVPTESMRNRLAERGFEHIVLWTRGVDHAVFRPGGKNVYPFERPIFLYAGRVAIEKNIAEFLAADTPGTKVVMGDGPARRRLQRQFPKARFLGYQPQDQFARHMAAADVLVFPSRTDTFGIVMIEAMACGVPVAALPVTGPIDIIEPGRTGVLDEDLSRACRTALELDGRACIEAASRYTWRQSARQLLGHLEPIR